MLEASYEQVLYHAHTSYGLQASFDLFDIQLCGEGGAVK